MSVLVISANKTFLDIILQLPVDVLPAGSRVISRTKPPQQHCRLDSLELESWDHFMNSDKIVTLNADRQDHLSEDLLRSFADCENTFLSISDRFCPRRPIWERKRLYYELLQYWHHYLSNSSTRIVVCNWMPHAGWDYVVYCVAKRLGILVLYAEVTKIDDRILFLEDYEKVDKVPSEFLRCHSRTGVIEQIASDLWKDFASSCSKLESDKLKNQQAVRIGPLRHLIGRRFVEPVVNYVRRMTTEGPPGLVFESRPFPMEDPTNSQASSYIRKCVYEAKMMSLRRYYTRLAGTVDYSSPYVFFPLHYQPERTTCPLGGVFHDQLLAVKTLASAIPEEWTIYVKDHPMQFGRNGTSRAIFRSRSFYDELSAVPKVRIVSLSEDTDKIIKNALFISTLTGSAGWEGLKKGKACVMFGVSWFAPCNSCYTVKSAQDVKRAIESILEKTGDEVELDLLKYLAYYNDRFILGGIDPKLGSRSKKDYETLLKSVAEALALKITELLSRQEDCQVYETSSIGAKGASK